MFEDVRRIPADAVEGQGQANRRTRGFRLHRIFSAHQCQRVGQNVQTAARRDSGELDRSLCPAQNHVGCDQARDGATRGALVLGHDLDVARCLCLNRRGANGRDRHGAISASQVDLVDIGLDAATRIVSHEDHADAGGGASGLHRDFRIDRRRVGGRDRQITTRRDAARKGAIIDNHMATGIHPVRCQHNPRPCRSGRSGNTGDHRRDLCCVFRREGQIAFGAEGSAAQTDNRLRDLFAANAGADQRIHSREQDILRLPTHRIEGQHDANRRARPFDGNPVFSGYRASATRQNRQIAAGFDGGIGKGRRYIHKDQVAGNDAAHSKTVLGLVGDNFKRAIQLGGDPGGAARGQVCRSGVGDLCRKTDQVDIAAHIVARDKTARSNRAAANFQADLGIDTRGIDGADCHVTGSAGAAYIAAVQRHTGGAGGLVQRKQDTCARRFFACGGVGLQPGSDGLGVFGRNRDIAACFDTCARQRNLCFRGGRCRDVSADEGVYRPEQEVLPLPTDSVKGEADRNRRALAGRFGLIGGGDGAGVRRANRQIARGIQAAAGDRQIGIGKDHVGGDHTIQCKGRALFVFIALFPCGLKAADGGVDCRRGVRPDRHVARRCGDGSGDNGHIHRALHSVARQQTA